MPFGMTGQGSPNDGFSIPDREFFQKAMPAETTSLGDDLIFSYDLSLSQNFAFVKPFLHQLMPQRRLKSSYPILPRTIPLFLNHLPILFIPADANVFFAAIHEDFAALAWDEFFMSIPIQLISAMSAVIIDLFFLFALGSHGD